MSIVVTADSSTVVTANNDTTVGVINRDNVVTIANATIDSITTELTQHTIVDTVVYNSVISSGSQGPQGVPGASFLYTYVTAAESIGGNRVVSTNSSGQLVYANSFSTHVLGISTASCTSGEVCEVQTSDMMTEPSWSFTVNMPVFAGDNGMLTQVPPTIGTLHTLGYAITPTKLFIDKQPPITLG